MLFTARKHTDRHMDREKIFALVSGDCVTPLQNFTIYNHLPEHNSTVTAFGNE